MFLSTTLQGQPGLVHELFSEALGSKSTLVFQH